MKLPIYDDSILAITSSIQKYYGIETPFSSMKELDELFATKKYKHVFFWILDGLGHYNLEELLDSKSVLRASELRPMSAVYPSTTVAATTCASCGLPPVASGWIGWNQYFKEYDANYVMFMDSNYYEKGKACPRNIESDLMKYDALWEQVKRQGYFGDFIYPEFRTPRVKCFKDQCDLVLEYANDPTKEGYTYVYWDWIDHLMHEHGIFSKEVINHTKEVNDCLATLKEQLPEDTLLIITADHGHVDVEYIDLENYPEITQTFSGLPAIEARAMSFRIKDECKEEFEKIFKENFKKDFMLYSHEEAFAMNLFGEGKEHPRVHEFIGDYIACAISNKAFKYITGGPAIGNHAGLTDFEMTTPLIVIKKD